MRLRRNAHSTCGGYGCCSSQIRVWLGVLLMVVLLYCKHTQHVVKEGSSSSDMGLNSQQPVVKSNQGSSSNMGLQQHVLISKDGTSSDMGPQQHVVNFEEGGSTDMGPQQHVVNFEEGASSTVSLVTPPTTGCEQRQQPIPVAMLMVVLGHEHEARHDQYWVAVANRRAYALQHGLPLYLVVDTMGSGQHPAWEKLVALQAVFQHSCAEWVWMSDADAYIMNITRSVAELAHNPLPHSNPQQLCNTSSTPDIIAAGACLTRINTGSMLWRNSDWTRQFVSDAWHSKFIARPANWWDQAAILHMYKIGDSKQHMCIVKQRAINAFPNMTNCHDGAGTFQEGDLLVHFPGGMKAAIADMNSRWLQAVPLVPHALQDASQHAPVFTVSQSRPGSSSAAGQHVHVALTSQLYAADSSQQTDFDLVIEPQSQGFSNWGWPVQPQPLGVEAILQRQLAQLQQPEQDSPQPLDQPLVSLQS